MQTATLQRKEERRLSKEEIIDSDIYKQLVQSIEDLKHGRMKRVR